jgi:hypothetical protein
VSVEAILRDGIALPIDNEAMSDGYIDKVARAIEAVAGRVRCTLRSPAPSTHRGRGLRHLSSQGFGLPRAGSAGTPISRDLSLGTPTAERRLLLKPPAVTSRRLAAM